MTSKQLKVEIGNALDQVPESALVDVLDYLNGLKGKSEKQLLRSKRIRRMLKEDSGLLTRLAK